MMNLPNNRNGIPLLKLQDATVVKNDKRILDRLTLQVRQGEHTAILGPNGAGKTALLRLITYQDYPLAHDDGTPPLQILGERLWDVFALRSQLGIVSADLQFSYLQRTRPGRVRGLETVLSGFFASYGVHWHQHITPEMRKQAEAALALMEASHLAGKFIEAMSTGELRRVLIARALVPDPRGLMLDEPTTGLDLVARQRFLDTLRRIARLGKTVILVTQHIEEIIPEIERVILLRRGKILLNGSKPEVLTSTNLTAMFGAPIRVEEAQGFYTAASV